MSDNTASPDRQLDGTHYSVMAIQPSRFAMANDYDADAFSILKYLSRHTRKEKILDLEKSMSFVWIRLDNAEFITQPRFERIPLRDYLTRNAFDNATQAALRDLHNWHSTGMGEGMAATLLQMSIKDLITSYQVP